MKRPVDIGKPGKRFEGTLQWKLCSSSKLLLRSFKIADPVELVLDVLQKVGQECVATCKDRKDFTAFESFGGTELDTLAGF